MKLMLVGRTGVGKTTLTQRLNEERLEYKKTQMVDYTGKIIDTPGEYVENRNYYKALNVVAIDAQIIGLVQSSLDEVSVFPPNFSSMFLNKKVIGIVTKVDLSSDTEIARNFLELAGVEEIIEIGKNCEIEILKNYIRGEK
ncbi:MULTISPECIES: EutP/PduV family microcompartment system protein [Psychrilyobacter]|uniref:EutP/PduV family microcompartment system protein n=1 Tax=Psychrilyobacter piezotolerans TaxID=2293438 RepID=A0ABX9KGM5_9FUSO|nr:MULTISPECIES: EutP/PduV family microcompartment system protein [Psychrilyobacter]MCS5422404.1 EutP/PduV family microcompartment system protein [Psychrilyobacter sp. S5]NDI78420.1 EutP/PduV family microcompartment system protein [Psychrilyobacter piezotolerans]RDE61145.1 ethanolamine utilization protein EutP [Psychrilyobacter sp. S5]REI40786.1 EutP/PduV family microcompartment system protein [Psychrilyobacter piezotolerans]